MSLSQGPLIVLDTCVLLAGSLRRVLFALAKAGCFQPIWSQVIGDEWQRNAARLWQLEANEVAKQWRDMQITFPQACVGEIERYKTGLRYSDAKDWHVIAAARSARDAYDVLSATVVTYNTRDFNRSELRRLQLDVQNPDDYLSRLWQEFAPLVREELRAMAFDQGPCTPEGSRAFVSGRLKRERLFRLNNLYLAK